MAATLDQRIRARASVRGVLGMAIALLVAIPTAGAGDCPLIRPPGLSAAAVDEVVASSFANPLGLRAEQLDTTKTFKALSRSRYADTTYLFVGVAITEALGFEALKAFDQAAHGRGAGSPFDTLSIRDMQAAARAAYFAGTDTPPPAATADMEFTVFRQTVRPPSPVEGWALIQCGGQNVTFQKMRPEGVSTASLRVATLPPYRSDAEFLQNVRTELSQALPSNLAIRPWAPQRVTGTTAPCVDATLMAEGSGTAMLIRARACYGSKTARYAFLTLFSHSATLAIDPPLAEADAFVLANSPP